MSSRRRILVSVLATSLLVVAGAAAGRALHDPSPSEEGPSEAARAPVEMVEVGIAAPLLVGDGVPDALADDADDADVVAATSAATGLALVPVDPGPAEVPEVPPSPEVVDLDRPASVIPELATVPEDLTIWPGAVPAGLLAAEESGDSGDLDVLAGSDEPIRSETSTGPGRVDPCVDPEDPGSDCPEGISSVVLGLTRPLWAYVRPLEAVGAEGASPSCAPGRSSNEQRIVAVVTNQPVDIALRVQLSSGTAPRQISLTTHPDDVVRWEEAPVRSIRHCVAIEGSGSPEWVGIGAVVTNDAGEVVTATTTTSIGIDAARPSVQVEPVGPNHVRVVAAHTVREAVEIRAWTRHPAPGRQVGCRRPGPEVFGSAPRSWSVSPTPFLYTERTERTLYVPFGEQVVVCASIAERSATGTGPRGPGDLDAAEQAVVVSAPDAVVPVIDVVDVEVLDAFDAVAVEVVRGQGAVEGSPCGGRWLEVAAGGAGGLDDVARSCDASADPAWHARDVGARQVVVRTRLRMPNGREGSTSMALPVHPRRCGVDGTGSCPAPLDEWYSVPISNLPQVRTACARGPLGGGCEPSPRGIVGRALLRVRYEPTTGPGEFARSAWTRSLAREDPLPVLIDVPGLRSADPNVELGVVRGTLRADRAVQWQVEVDPSCRIDDGPRSLAADEPTDRLELELTGLCPGNPTDLTVTLTDPESDVTSTWTPSSGWHHGRVVADAPVGALRGVVTVTPPTGSSGPRWSLDASASVQITDPGWSLLGADEGPGAIGVRSSPQPLTLGALPSFAGVAPDPCASTPAEATGAEGVNRVLGGRVGVGAKVRLHVQVHLTEADPPARGRTGCRRTGRTFSAVLTGEVSVEEARSGRGVRLSSPGGDGTPAITVVVTFDPARR